MHNEVQELKKQLRNALETITHLEELIAQLTQENQQLPSELSSCVTYGPTVKTLATALPM